MVISCDKIFLQVSKYLSFWKKKIKVYNFFKVRCHRAGIHLKMQNYKSDLQRSWHLQVRLFWNETSCLCLNLCIYSSLLVLFRTWIKEDRWIQFQQRVLMLSLVENFSRYIPHFGFSWKPESNYTSLIMQWPVIVFQQAEKSKQVVVQFLFTSPIFIQLQTLIYRKPGYSDFKTTAGTFSALVFRAFNLTLN